MGDFIVDNLGWVLAGIFVAMLCLIGIAVWHEQRAFRWFMTECTAERAEYECVSMWRVARR